MKLRRLRVEMFTIILAGVTILPFVGIVLMETGAFGMNLSTYGYRNGASAAYALHIVVLFSVYKIVQRFLRRRLPEARPLRNSDALRRRAFQRLALAVIVVNALLALFLYFVAGADQVWSGAVKKGEFRSQFGELGVYAYLARDFLTPMLCALVAFLYRRCSPRGYERVLLGANFVLVFVNASLWGAKATGVLKLFPALLLLLPSLSVPGLLTFVVFAYGSTVLFATFFDDMNLESSVSIVLDRATIGMGDTAWKIWDVREYGFPDYWPTLVSGLGGRVSSLLGFYSRGSGYEWYDYDFPALITLIAKDYRSLEVTVSNVTATTFGEGVIAFGSPGFLFMAVLAGICVALSRDVLERAKFQNRPLMAILAANYFGFSVQNWLEAGGITVLLNIPHAVSSIMTVILAYGLLSFAGWPMRPRRVISAAGPRARTMPLPMNGAESLGYPAKAPETGG